MTGKDYFIPKMFHRLLFPSLLSSLGFAFADMADALVVGQRMGETGLAAISLCLPVFMVINFFMDGLGLGGSVHYSRLLGQGKAEEAVGCFNRILYSALLVGILIGCTGNLLTPQVLALLGTTSGDGLLYQACKEYMQVITMGAPLLMLNVILANFLRNDNNPGLAAAGFLTGNIVDVSLNILLVIRFDMGTRGAALSTVIGSAVAICCYSRGILFKKANILKLTPVKMDLRETGNCFKTGFSMSVRHLFQFIFFLTVNRLLMELGGEAGVSVFDLVFNASFFVTYMYNGTAEAMQPLVSTFAGENSEADCREVLTLAKRWGLLFGGIAAGLIFLFPHTVTAMFGLSPEVAPAGAYALQIYSIGFAFAGVNILHENYYLAREDRKSAFMLAGIREFAVLLLCTVVFGSMGLSSVWLLFPVTELISMVLFAAYRRKKAKTEILFDENRILRMNITKEQQDLAELLGQSEAFCERWNGNMRQTYFVTLVIEETCASIIRNALDKVSDGRIRVTLVALKNGDFMLHILDNAVEFNPFMLNAKKVEKNKEFDIDGVSMTLIKTKSKEFMHRECQGFNSLVIRI